MLKLLGIAVALLVIGVVVFAAMKPDTFRVSRSISIKAPPEKIFPIINDLKQWSAWSPYEKKDPAMKRTFGALTAGKGAVYEWEGNKDVGKGRMEISDATPPSKLLIQLHFMQPFEGRNVAEFTVDGKGGESNVTWAMYGPATFVSKLIGVFMDMDRMIGDDFAAGLANLKALAEK